MSKQPPIKNPYAKTQMKPIEQSSKHISSSGSSKLTELEARDDGKDKVAAKRGTALRLFYAYRKFMKLPKEPTEVEFEGDNLLNFFRCMCHWVSERPIPHGFDEDLMPPKNSTSNKCIVPITIVQYIGQTIQHLRRTFPNHEDFEGLDPKKDDAAPEWWSWMKSACESNCTKFQLLHAGDYTFGSDEIRPLYMDLS